LRKKLLEIQSNKSNTVTEDLKRYTEMNSKLTVDNEVFKVQLTKEQNKSKSLESELVNLRTTISKSASQNGQQPSTPAHHSNSTETLTLRNEIQELKQLLQVTNTLFKENLVVRSESMQLKRNSKDMRDGSTHNDKKGFILPRTITEAIPDTKVQVSRSAGSQERKPITEDDDSNLFLHGEGKKLKSLGILPSLP